MISVSTIVVGLTYSNSSKLCARSIGSWELGEIRGRESDAVTRYNGLLSTDLICSSKFEMRAFNSPMSILAFGEQIATILHASPHLIGTQSACSQKYPVVVPLPMLLTSSMARITRPRKTSRESRRGDRLSVEGDA